MYSNKKERTYRDYSSVLVKEDLIGIDEEKLAQLRIESKAFIDAVNKRTAWSPTRAEGCKNQTFTHIGLAGIIISPSNIKEKRRKLDESNVELTLIQANAACYSQEMLFNILLDRNISYNTLAIISRDIDDLKTLSELINKLNMLLKENVKEEDLKLLRSLIKKYEDKTEKLNQKLEAIIKIFEKYYALSDVNVIVARLLQITVFERELYKNMEKQKIKTHS